MYNPDLPLIDLHRHLDGNIRPASIWQLAQHHGIQLPANNIEQFEKLATINDKAETLVEFLTKLDYGVSVLKTLDDCKRIAYENVEDLATAKIDYAELRFSPFYMAMEHKLPLEGVIEAVQDGIEQGKKAFNRDVNLIGILSRSYGVENCQKELDAILAQRKHFVAVDLAGDEQGFSGELFESHFKQVRDAQLNITVHAGEACGAASVWQAVTQLGAQRIGHGVNCYTDDKLMEHLVKHNISIESCLTSNYQTGTVADLAKHPIRLFLEKGINVCLNTDDPAVEATELIEEFEIAHNTVGLTMAQITQLQENAINACFLSDSEKQRLRKAKIK